MGHVGRWGTLNTVWLVFIGWVISLANEWEGYSNYFGEKVRIYRSWVAVHFLILFGQPQDCCGAGRYVT